MKKILYIILLSSMVMSCGIARSIAYTYKPFSVEGCGVEYTTAFTEGSYNIVVTVKSDRLVFTENPEMLLKLSDDTVIALQGERINTSEHQGGVLVNNIIVPVTSLYAVAQFSIKEDDIIQLNKGISKISITTFPIKHEKYFNNDIIGKAIYKQYLLLKREETF